MSFDVNPPLTRNERRGLLLMIAAALLTLFGVATFIEGSAHRAAQPWPPHVSSERSQK